MGINYQLIGIGLGFLLGVWALIVAESAEGRIFIAIIMAVLFFLPLVWRGQAAQLVTFLGWIIFGAGCYFFIKWRGVGLK
jgi:hypothetical protein